MADMQNNAKKTLEDGALDELTPLKAIEAIKNKAFADDTISSDSDASEEKVASGDNVDAVIKQVELIAQKLAPCVKMVQSGYEPDKMIMTKVIKPLVVMVENMIPNLRDLQDYLYEREDARADKLGELIDTTERDIIEPLLPHINKY